MPHTLHEPRSNLPCHPGGALTFVILVLFAMLTIGMGSARAVGVDRDRAAVLLANKTTAAAQRKSDGHTLARTLDKRFTLTDSTGSVLDKASFAADALDSAPSDDVTEPHAYIYGGLAVVTGGHHIASLDADTRYLHVFVRKGARWLAFAFFETAIQPPASAASSTGRVLPVPILPEARAGSCDNPCRTIPFSPRTSAERAVVDAYKAVELESVTGDVESFAGNLADELLIVVPNFTGKPVTRAAAIASHRRMKEQNIFYPPVPVTRASVTVFGSGALMVSRHDLPPDPAKSSILAQVWTLRDGRWQLALSQQIRVRP